MERTICEKLKSKYKFGETEIYVGSGLIPAVPPTVKEVFCDGNIVVLYESAMLAVADRLAAEFRESGYRVFMKEVESDEEIPEFSRFVFGVGSDAAVACVKAVAEKLSADSALFLTAPPCEGVLCGYKIKQIFVDSGVLSACTKESVAAGWGIILSEPLTQFERYFAEKILGEPHEEYPRFKELHADADEAALTIRLLELSSLDRREDNATVMARLLMDAAEKQGVQKRLLGEYKFVCASVLTVFYSQFICSPAIDCAPPPSHDVAIDEIVKLTGRNREMLINSFDFLPVNSYFRINYILGEYRLDLLERLKAIDLHSAGKRWRRLYPDAGYWLQKAFTASMLINALRLSSEIGNGILRYICETGFAA